MIEGASRASPAATVRTAVAGWSRLASLSKKPGPRPSRLSRRPGGSGGDRGGVGNADARGVLDRPYHGLPDEYVDRFGLCPLADLLIEWNAIFFHICFRGLAKLASPKHKTLVSKCFAVFIYLLKRLKI